MGAKEAIVLASKANEIYVIKGKKIVHMNLKDEKPSKEQLTKLMLGPTGNLRAPTILKDKVLIVGFNGETYESVLNN